MLAADPADPALLIVVGIVMTVAAFLIASRLTKIHKSLEDISKKLGQDRPDSP